MSKKTGLFSVLSHKKDAGPPSAFSSPSPSEMHTRYGADLRCAIGINTGFQQS